MGQWSFFSNLRCLLYGGHKSKTQFVTFGYSFYCLSTSGKHNESAQICLEIYNAIKCLN